MTLLRPNRALLGLSLVALLGGAANAAARVDAKAGAYVKANALHSRAVKIDLPGRQTQRIFVPVLPTTVKDFTARFTKKSSSMIIRQAGDLEHPAMIVDEQRALWNQTITTANRFIAPEALPIYNTMNPANGGRYLVLDLDGGMQAHFEQYLSTVTQQTVPHTGAVLGGCMWWLVHAEVLPNVKLAHAMGVTQSRAPSNLINKLVHAGNDRVRVVGIGVPDLAAFDAMTDAQLLGAPPAGGPEEAVKN